MNGYKRVPGEATALSRRAFLNGVLTAGGVAVASLIPGGEALAWDLISKPSPKQQKQVGEQAAQQILKQYKEVKDGRARHFEEMGSRLVAALPQKDRETWDFRFHVLDSKEVNAFALPGGPMFMFTGLYKLLDTDDAMAGVTGHEMTHVRKEHWAKAYKKQQERELPLIIGLTIFRAPNWAQQIASLADSAIGMKFSRSEEDEADAGGLQNMVDAGYNPQGMIQLFETLKKVSGNGESGPFGDFLSDHPLTSDRIKHTQQRIAALGDEKKFPPLTPLKYDSLS
jgi:predicted Zn-dependent protease